MSLKGIATALRAAGAAALIGSALTVALVGDTPAGAQTALAARNGPPVNTGPPQISGEAVVGQTLSCVPGTWTGRSPMAFSFQWLGNGVAIPSATEATYLVPASAVSFILICQVTASNRAGEQAARSQGIPIPVAPCCGKTPGGAPPLNTHPPAISGSAVPGGLLSCGPGAWSGTPPPTLSYRWLVDGTLIAGETGPDYTIATVDVPRRVACEVRASNAEGRASALSPAVTVAYSGLAPAEAVIAVCGGLIQLYGPNEIRRALAAGLACSRRARMAGVRRRGGFTFTFRALQAGTVKASWYHVRRSATPGKGRTRQALVLSGRAGSRDGDVVVRAKLTPVGRALLARAGRLRVLARATFTPTGGAPVTVRVSVLLRR